jgi:hypothetical protein
MTKTLDRCRRCNSDKIIHGVPLEDAYGQMGTWRRQSQVRVDGEPDAMLFKDAAYGGLSLDICGECGRAELQVNNFQELWEKAEQANQ